VGVGEKALVRGLCGGDVHVRSRRVVGL
jgi:hypothetical protein